jgi:hypothetical protein
MLDIPLGSLQVQLSPNLYVVARRSVATTWQSPTKQMMLIDEIRSFNGRLLRFARNDMTEGDCHDPCGVSQHLHLAQVQV